ETQAFADRFADNVATCSEYPRDDCGIYIGNETFEQRRPIHHRDSGDGDIILDSESLALEKTFGTALNVAAPVPGIQGILPGCGTLAAIARIIDNGRALFKLVEPGVLTDGWFQQSTEALHVSRRKAEMQTSRDPAEVINSRGLNRHGL